MSFWPFPNNLAELLQAAAVRGPLVEIGAGEGPLARRLREIGVPTIELDLAPVPRRPGVAQLRADAAALPWTALRGGVVLGNCVRHWPGPRRIAAVREIWRSLDRGAIAAVFEDDPAAGDEAEDNYREALRLLADADPSRGVALGLEEFAASVRPIWGEPEAVIHARNAENVADPMAPLRWLRARGTGPRLERLESAVARHGMAYGAYWSAIWRRP